MFRSYFEKPKAIFDKHHRIFVLMLQNFINCITSACFNGKPAKLSLFMAGDWMDISHQLLKKITFYAYSRVTYFFSNHNQHKLI